MPRGVHIGKASGKTGLTVDAIRFYEKERLLREPPRSEGGYRLYSERDIEHLLFIRKAQELGFSLAEIRELLLIQDERVEACTHVRDLIHQRLSSVREKIEALQNLERNLQEASRKCTDALTHDSSDPQHECCPVLEGIAHAERTKEKQVNDVEVLYFEGCPNHEPAVERVREVLRAEGSVDEVKEVEVSDPETAERLRFPGALASEFFGLVCRTYRDGCCQSGVPSAELIREALRKGE